MKNPSVDGVRAAFPIAKLTKLEKPFSHGAIKTLVKELTENAADIDIIDGNLGHSALILTDAVYKKHNGSAFVTPTSPTVPKRSTDPIINADANKKYDAALHRFQLFRATETALKQLLMEATPPGTFSTLEDDIFGLRTVTTRTMITYLIDQYPEMTPEEIIQNEAQIFEPWDTDTPISDTFSKLTIAQRHATTSKFPISDDKLMLAALQSIINSKVLEWECKAWQERDEANKTFKKMVQYFTKADNNRMRSVKPAPTTYQGANAAKETTAAATTTPKEKPKLYYCWTHGFTTNPKHTSTTCNRPKPDHKIEATADNKLDGSTHVWYNKKRQPPSNTE